MTSIALLPRLLLNLSHGHHTRSFWEMLFYLVYRSPHFFLYLAFPHKPMFGLISLLVHAFPWQLILFRTSSAHRAPPSTPPSDTLPHYCKSVLWVVKATLAQLGSLLAELPSADHLVCYSRKAATEFTWVEMGREASPEKQMMLPTVEYFIYVLFTFIVCGVIKNYSWESS